MTKTWSFVFLAACLIAGAAEARSDIREAGGSNYVIVGSGASPPFGPAWSDNNLFRTPACQLQNVRSEVESDLAAMHAHGQRKLAILLFHERAADTAPCHGYLLNSKGGRFDPQVTANLRALIALLDENGFDELELRFSPKGPNAPNVWRSWQPDLFAENWGVIQSTLNAIGLHGHGHVRIMVDLGAELAGILTNAVYTRYEEDLWRNYVQQFGPANAYGFSVAYGPNGPGRLGRMLDAIAVVGTPPHQLAIDIGDNVDTGLVAAAKEVQAHGIEHPRFFVMETRYADPQTRRELFAAAAAEVAIRAVMQWPLARGGTPRTFIMPPLEYIYEPARHGGGEAVAAGVTIFRGGQH